MWVMTSHLNTCNLACNNTKHKDMSGMVLFSDEYNCYLGDH